ncbi:MAG TPA: DUF1631 family protein [Usitatibacter sp.]
MKDTGNHIARRVAASAEPSPLTGLRDMLATAFAADIAAVTPMVCDVLRDEIHVTSAPAQRDFMRTALVILARQSGDLALGVAQEFRSRFDATLLSASKPKDLSPGAGLSLTDETHVDVDIALAQCAARLKEQSGANLFQVTARIAAMLDKPSLDEGDNPIAPLELARSLMQALARLDLHAKQRLIVLKAFDPALLCIVPDLYQHANGLLAEVGVLPEFKAQYGRPVTRPAQPARANPVLDEGALAAILDRLLNGQSAHGRQTASI